MSHEELVLQRLLLRYRAGEKQALNELADVYGYQLDRHARRLLPRNQREEAADIVQKTFIRVMTTTKGWEPAQGTATGWILTILRNLVYDFCRATKSHRGIATTDIAPAGEDPSSVDPAGRMEELIDPKQARAEELAETEEELEALRDCINRLRLPQREVVVLRGIDGKTHEEVAEVLGISHVAAAQRFHRALKVLTACMKDKGF